MNIPLMPKGVDHSVDAAYREAIIKQVNIPLMPKGVDHISEMRLNAWLKSEYSIDAERR